MAAGDLVVQDWQLELRGVLMGVATNFVVTPPGMQGIGVPQIKTRDTDLSLAHGTYGGPDLLDKRVVTVPITINRSSAATALTSFTSLASAWSYATSDIPLHFQLPGWGKRYVTGRPRGFVENLENLRSGVIRVLCTFEALDPTIYVVGGG